MADIVGVLWVDESTAELREVVFHFVNAGVLSRFEARGFTRFLRVPSGAWIVDEWLLRLPRLALQQSSAYVAQKYVLTGYDEHGGGILYSEDGPGRCGYRKHRLTTRAERQMIRKLKSGQYRLYSRKKNPKTGRRRNLGTFKSLAAAKKHERAVQFFKRGG